MSGYKQLIIDTCKKHNVLRNQTAYVLATAYWETAHTFKPVKEGYWLKNAERWRKKNLRYWPWYGRGFVQLTWEVNYIRAGKELGVDLTTRPDDVMEPKIAADILVVGMIEGWFTKKKLSDYITLKKSQFTPARRIINGTDEAQAIAEIARKYDKELLAAGYGVGTVVPFKPKKPSKPSSTENVMELQALLCDAGFPTAKDGIPGPNTDRKLKDFQQSIGISPTGIVDETTLTALRKAAGYEVKLPHKPVQKKSSKGGLITAIIAALAVLGAILAKWANELYTWLF